MSMDLLKEIAASRLPVSFRTQKEIDQVRILRQAGLVIAFIPAPADPLNFSGAEHAAQVLAITQKGREELQRFRYPGDELAGTPMRTGFRQRLRAAVERAHQALH